MTAKKILSLISDKTPESKPIDAECACCGDRLEDGGVRFKSLFSASTFNMNHDFYDASLEYVCSYCAVLFSRENWRLYCERSGIDPYFPEVPGKSRFLANWVFFSHAFYKDTHEKVMNRQRWRELLTLPPEPPFCFVISTMCKKHLIHKTPIQYSKEMFQIRFEDAMLSIVPEEFKKLLTFFEDLYSAGLSKSSIVTGNYSTSALLKVDRKLFLKNERFISGYRNIKPELLSVCEFVGAKNAK